LTHAAGGGGLSEGASAGFESISFANNAAFSSAACRGGGAAGGGPPPPKLGATEGGGPSDGAARGALP